MTCQEWDQENTFQTLDFSKIYFLHHFFGIDEACMLLNQCIGLAEGEKKRPPRLTDVRQAC